MAFKIYTKTGDAGETGLFGGKRVPKDHLRIDAYGTLDELNSHIGLLLAFLQQTGYDPHNSEISAEIQHLSKIQGELFTLGSQLATPPEQKLSIAPLSEAAIERLEGQIDHLDNSLAPLTAFILPAGSAATAQAHVCRTVTRRAERAVVTLNHESPLDFTIIRYLNRLSDYFFTLARSIAKWSGEKDVTWSPAKA